MYGRSNITTDAHILDGTPIVRGTRLAVDFIMGVQAGGGPVQALTQAPRK